MIDELPTWTVRCGDVRAALAALPAGSVQTCVTSPPYWGLRDYGTGSWEGGDAACDHRQQLGGEGDTSAKQNTSVGTQTLQFRDTCRKCGATRVDNQIGLESTPDAYVESLVSVFRLVWNVLRDDGTVWLNLGDSYAAGRGGSAMPAETLAGGEGGVGSEDAHRGRLAQVPNTKNPNAPMMVYQPHRNAGAIGLKHKDLVGIPWRVAFALQADGWYLRSDIIWHKPNPMPESVLDRPTKSHEYIFLLSKRPKYYYNADAIKEPYALDSFARYQYAFGGAKNEALVEANKDGIGRRTSVIGMRPYGGQATKDYESARAQDPSDTKRRVLDSMATGAGRNKRSVWTVTTQPYPDAHFATYPEDLVEPCILAGSRVGDTVLDPFTGSGTTGAVAIRQQRSFVGIELNPEYVALAERRIGNVAPLFARRVS